MERRTLVLRLVICELVLQTSLEDPAIQVHRQTIDLAHTALAAALFPRRLLPASPPPNSPAASASDLRHPS